MMDDLRDDDWELAAVTPVLPSFTADEEKMRQLVLFISWEARDDESLGRTKLNKILFFSDFEAYYELGEPISGHEYECRPFGPAPRGIRDITRKMIEDQAVAVRRQDYGGYRQVKLVPLVAPRPDALSVEQKDLVKSVVRRWWGKTAREICRASHDFIGYQMAELNAVIPYEMGLIEESAVTVAESRYAAHLAPVAKSLLARA